VSRALRSRSKRADEGSVITLPRCCRFIAAAVLLVVVASSVGPATAHGRAESRVAYGGRFMEPDRTVPVLGIVSVTPNISSVKVVVSPYPGARDYRIFNVTESKHVKYAGMLDTYDGYGGHKGTAVHTELETNGLEPGTTTEFIVEAVDSLGPIGTAEATPLSFYDNYNAPASSFPLGPFMMPMAGHGSDEQPTGSRAPNRFG
jgi:hypothetical protein